MHGSSKTRLARVHRRKDVFASNQAIRVGRVAAGDFAEDFLAKTEFGRRAFSVGGRVLITRNDPALGLRAGMPGTVQEITDEQMRIAFDETFSHR